jgi:transmembrane sensor
MKEDIIEDLLIRYILEEANTNERRQVEDWLQGSDDHTKRFEQTKFLLDESKRLAQSSPLTEQEAWEKFKVKRADSRPIPVRKLYTRWLQAAAAVLVIAAGSWAAWYYGRTQSNEWITLKAYEKTINHTLPDGSVIQLNKHSKISYSGRTVRLNGEAFFKVVHNSAKPFKVYTHDVSITDIGTAFNVRSAGDKVEVIVESGIVSVSRKASSVILKQKQMVLVQPGSMPSQPEGNNDLLYQYYRTDEFVTDHTPLGRFVKVLNEAYGVNIQIIGSSLADLRITGTYKRESLDKILQVLLLTTPEIHRINQGNTIILTR